MTGKKRNKLGLTERDMSTIHDILGRFPEVETVLIFGSRAKGTYKLGSDIDLVIMDAGVDETVVCKLNDYFSESCLPYFVDLICYPSLKDIALKEHIDRVGVSFYSQSSCAHSLRDQALNQPSDST